MIVKIDKSFQKDVDKIKDSEIKLSIAAIIEEIQKCSAIFEIANLKKLTGYKTLYRIRIGDYRIGFEYTKDQEIVLIRFLNRKEIYRKWP